jgi:hypothetical protein
VQSDQQINGFWTPAFAGVTVILKYPRFFDPLLKVSQGLNALTRCFNWASLSAPA